MKSNELKKQMISELSEELQKKAAENFPDIRQHTWKELYAVLGDSFLRAHPTSKALIEVMPEYIKNNDIKGFRKENSKLFASMHDVSAKFFGIQYRDYLNILNIDYVPRLSEKEKKAMTIEEQVKVHPNTPEIKKSVLRYKKKHGSMENMSINDSDTHELLNSTAQILKITPAVFLKYIGIEGYSLRATKKAKENLGRYEALILSEAANRHKAILGKYKKENDSLDGFEIDCPKEFDTISRFAERHELSFAKWMEMLGHEYTEPEVLSTKEEFFKKIAGMQKKDGAPGELELDRKTARQLRYLAFWEGVPEYDYLLENSDFFISKVHVRLYDYLNSTIKQLEERFGKGKDEGGLKPDISRLWRVNNQLYQRVRNIRRYTYPKEPVWYTVVNELGFKYSGGKDTVLGEDFPEEELKELAHRKNTLSKSEEKRLNKLVFQKGTLCNLSCRDVYKEMGIDVKGTHREPNRMIMIREDITYDQHLQNMKERDEKRARKEVAGKLARVIKTVADEKERG